MKKKVSANPKNSAQKSVKRKPRGKPFAPDNPYKFRSREDNDGKLDPRINPGGRPKLLGESYKEWLAKINAQGVTNAEAVAVAMGSQAIKGDVGAAREIRAATEGDKIEQFNWDVSQLNDEQLARLADGDDIRSIIATSSASRTGTPPANQSAPGDTES